MADTSNSTSRFHHLDALRASALLLGVVFHAAESFCPERRSWAIIDRNAHLAFDLFQYVCHSFRMEIFFLIAGLFAHLVIERKGVSAFVKDRIRRIALPFVGGWFVLYPLLMFIWMWGKWSSGSLADFGIPAALHSQGPLLLTANLFGEGTFLGEAFNLVHLWFLYYLILIYIAAIALRWLFRTMQSGERVMSLLDRGFARVFHSPWKMIFFAMITMPLTTLMRGGVDTPNKSLIPIVPVLLVYGIFFATGWMIHRRPKLIECLTTGWSWHLLVGVVLAALSYFPRTILSAVDPTGGLQPWAQIVHNVMYPFMMWAFVFGISGLFVAVKREESRRWRYLADSSYWIYLLHPVIVVPLQIVVADIDVNAVLKLAVINAVAFPILLSSYHFLVRPTFIGLILNGRRIPVRFPWEEKIPADAGGEAHLQAAG